MQFYNRLLANLSVTFFATEKSSQKLRKLLKGVNKKPFFFRTSPKKRRTVQNKKLVWKNKRKGKTKRKRISV